MVRATSCKSEASTAPLFGAFAGQRSAQQQTAQKQKSVFAKMQEKFEELKKKTAKSPAPASSKKKQVAFVLYPEEQYSKKVNAQVSVTANNAMRNFSAAVGKPLKPVRGRRLTPAAVSGGVYFWEDKKVEAELGGKESTGSTLQEQNESQLLTADPYETEAFWRKVFGADVADGVRTLARDTAEIAVDEVGSLVAAAARSTEEDPFAGPEVWHAHATGAVLGRETGGFAEEELGATTRAFCGSLVEEVEGGTSSSTRDSQYLSSCASGANGSSEESSSDSENSVEKESWTVV